VCSLSCLNCAVDFLPLLSLPCQACRMTSLSLRPNSILVPRRTNFKARISRSCATFYKTLLLPHLSSTYPLYLSFTSFVFSAIRFRQPTHSPYYTMSRRSGTVHSPDKQNNSTSSNDGSEKQKMLLSADTGHFSMIRYAPTRPHKSVHY
jgi:hypothetical protein